ncbi:membrane protease subunit (stomatin/prohibitin family) [Ruminiclostridium sufflavum DSM 19573]|uniref:Membrane protease subunit (Stomatin/prohibitin family) n=1 Tax=Ruminiclostridium sufflavum DSM 19573 TaxID=1121337 RepID=A0A318XI41_9FIRM|nr:SPFH domain-containing protein [Ruminiclostridium sufflavum]PYG85013.1 membrane protease subunit (stomatin/prohibitin family) [Ruminiclostridium sufflavum DSM 19573]
MGLFNFIKSQFIDVIEWTDNSTNIMVYQFPVENREIKMGAQLTVREAQMAVFVDEGQLTDVFTPGRYTLDTQNLPVLTKLKSWKYGFNSPFKSEIYFVNTKQFTNCKWGTTNPIMMRDAEFGMLRMRMFGIYSFKVADPAVFLREVFGTASFFTVDGITGQLKSKIVSGVADLLAEAAIPALDLSSKYDEIALMSRKKLGESFSRLGLSLESLIIENISLPEEVEKVLDKRTSMGIIGDSLNQYTRYQAAESIRDAAQNPGGMAGAGVGMGAGIGIGNMFAEAFSAQQSKQPEAKAPEPAKIKCSNCGAALTEQAKFCLECGTKVEPSTKKCSGCGNELSAGSKFCQECGQKQ